MKAIVQDRYGGAEVLALRDIEAPAIGEHEVLVRVCAAGVDAGVWHIMTGLPYLGRLAFGLRAPRQRVRGMDIAGRVEAVGKSVTRLKVGDEVFGRCTGGFAELACARADQLVHKPAHVGFAAAASVPTSGLTALQALVGAAKVQAGQRVLIIGAGGGVGSFAVQIARALGAEVTGVCSTDKQGLVRSLGAARVIDYTREDCTDGATQYDVILDIAGNRPLAALRRALTPTGTLVFVGGEGGGRWFGGMGRQLGALLLGPFIRQRMRSVLAMARLADLQRLQELVASGAVVPAVERTYPLGEVPAAIRHFEAGLARGKLVIAMDC